MADPTRIDPSRLWDAMRESGAPFALLDPATHQYLDGNAQYAALFELDVEGLKLSRVSSLFPPEMTRSIEALHHAFVRGTLHVIRGQMSLRRANGSTVDVTGWSRRMEGVTPHPLVVTSAAETAGEGPADDLYWVAQAPHVFGLPADRLEASPDIAERRAEQLDQHLWRIGLEVRAAGLLPAVGGVVPLAAVKELGDLTTRQREIVTRLAAGERVTEIAREMYLSPSTVRNHLAAVFRKFGVHSQVELISVLRKLQDVRP